MPLMPPHALGIHSFSNSVPALAAQLDAVALAEGLPRSLPGTSQPSADADHQSRGASDA